MSNTKKVIAGVVLLILSVSLYNNFSEPVKQSSQVSSFVSDTNSGNNDLEMDRENPPAKKSTTGICHPKGGTYYGKTMNFVPYASVASCLDSGGRLPKR